MGSRITHDTDDQLSLETGKRVTDLLITCCRLWQGLGVAEPSAPIQVAAESLMCSFTSKRLRQSVCLRIIFGLTRSVSSVGAQKSLYEADCEEMSTSTSSRVFLIAANRHNGLELTGAHRTPP